MFHNISVTYCNSWNNIGWLNNFQSILHIYGKYLHISICVQEKNFTKTLAFNYKSLFVACYNIFVGDYKLKDGSLNHIEVLTPSLSASEKYIWILSKQCSLQVVGCMKIHLAA